MNDQDYVTILELKAENERLREALEEALGSLAASGCEMCGSAEKRVKQIEKDFGLDRRS